VVRPPPSVGEGMLSVPEETEEMTRRPLEEKMFNASAGVVWARTRLKVSLDAFPWPHMALTKTTSLSCDSTNSSTDDTSPSGVGVPSTR
jgi:hypothetical protein